MPEPTSSSPIPLPQSSDAVAHLLADDRRRAIYLWVSHSHRAVTAGEVAEQFAIHRNAAKHHLDKLLDAGLLRAEFKRINGRRGPGAGRPSKLYTVGDLEMSFSVPERHYDLLAKLLLKALTQGDNLETVGNRFGRELAAAMRPRDSANTGRAQAWDGVKAVLDQLGFGPSIETDADGCTWITTQNCPFGSVALEAPEGEVCRLDRAIIAGVLEEYGCSGADVKGHTSMAGGADVCVREVRV